MCPPCPQALLTTGLALPTILVLNAMFAHLRSPHERAIKDEFASKSDADYDDCCKKVRGLPGHFKAVHFRWSLVLRV